MKCKCGADLPISCAKSDIYGNASCDSCLERERYAQWLQPAASAKGKNDDFTPDITKERT